MFAGAPGVVSWGGTATPVAAGQAANDNAVEQYVAGCGIPFVDGDGRPILSKADTFYSPGWVDAVPDDSSFFIANSFETFQENPELVSGSDLTNATPLHLRLEYQQQDDTTNFFEPLNTNGDVLTSFVHIDSVLRLMPDGTLISSV